MNNWSDNRVTTGQSINRLIEKSKNAHRAFTLVEMLIVVAILAILMSISFKLIGVGDEDARRSETLVKLQKVENCLSGYYAAFGSYPPVKVHGTRDIYCAVDENGDQDQDKGGSSTLEWRQVRAACQSQPFGCEYPGNEYDNEIIETWTEEIAIRVSNPSDYPNYAPGKYAYAEVFQGQSTITGPNANDGFRSEWDNAEWKVVKLFKFGMMSYLLPRYLFMMGGDGQFFGAPGNACAQWTNNNDMPSDPFEGRKFDGWDDVRDYAQSSREGNKNHNDLVRVANIPSQAVCARWMPNLEQTCRVIRQLTFFGIKIGNEGASGAGTGEIGLWLSDDYPPDPGTHYPPSSKKPYKNAFITILDGWDREFYYYSPAPYQSYIVWSAGPNGKTFPPWMPLDKLQGNDKKSATEWMSDDIMQMSH